MGRIFIDTDQLHVLSRQLRGAGGELGDINLDLVRGWAHTMPPPVQLVAVEADSAAIQAQLLALAAEVAAQGVVAEAEAVFVEVAEAGKSALGMLDWLAPALPAIAAGVIDIAAIFGGGGFGGPIADVLTAVGDLIPGVRGDTVRLTAEATGFVVHAVGGVHEISQVASGDAAGLGHLPWIGVALGLIALPSDVSTMMAAYHDHSSGVTQTEDTLQVAGDACDVVGGAMVASGIGAPVGAVIIGVGLVAEGADLGLHAYTWLGDHHVIQPVEQTMVHATEHVVHYEESAWHDVQHGWDRFAHDLVGAK